MERFAKIFNGLKQVTISTKHSILDVWQGLEYASKTKSMIYFQTTARQNGLSGVWLTNAVYDVDFTVVRLALL